MISILMLISFEHAAAQGSAPGAQVSWVEGRILVKPRPGISDEDFQQILSRNGGRSIDSLDQISVHIVEVPPQAEDAVINALSNNPGVEYAEKDRLLALSSVIPNDPIYPNQWHLPKIQTPTAWDTTAGSGIVVAVLDTGVQGDHPDLANNLISGWNVASNNSDTSPIHWHGTSVAGTVAATANNSLGVASVAWEAAIMPIRVSDRTDGVAQYSALANGILWAADHGANVANLSYQVSGGAFTIDNAAQYFRNKGGVTVVAAGNNNTDGGYSDDPYVITVSATDQSDNKASFSNYGNDIDVSAPGVGIPSTYTSSGYANVSGTSFSSPATAGVVALIMAANPSLTPLEVEAVLEESADDPIATSDWHPYFGWGRVNAASAVQLALQTSSVDGLAPSVNIFSPQSNSTISGSVLVEVDATDNVGVSGVDLYAGTQFIGRDITAPYQFSWDSTQFPDGNVTLVAFAQDAAGNEGSGSLSVLVNNQPVVQDDIAPTVGISSPADGATVSRNVSIDVTGSDNVGVTKLSVYLDGSLLCTSNSSPLSCAWNTRKAGAGSHTIDAVGEDAAGNRGTASVIVYSGSGSKPGNGKGK